MSAAYFEHITRAQHLEFCKQRALEYIDHDELTFAVTSMVCDMGKHPEAARCIDVPKIKEGMNAALSLNRAAVRRWIESFR